MKRFASDLLPVCFDAETWLFLWDIKPKDDQLKLFDILASWLKPEGILIPEEIFREIEAKNELLHDWLKSNSNATILLDEAIENEVSAILLIYPLLIDPDQIGFQSDVFLFATAIQCNASIMSIRKDWKSLIDRYDLSTICASFPIKLTMLPSIDDLLAMRKN